MERDQREQLALKFLSVLSHPDPEIVNSVVVADVVWSFPGRSAISGEAHGVAQIVAHGQAICAFGVHVEVLRSIHSYSGIAILLHNTAERAGKVLDEQVAAVFSFRDDRIARLDTFLSDVPMAEAFFG